VYNASDLFKRAISQPNRDLRLRCTIDNIVYTESDIQECSIEESILTGEDFKFGSSTASRMEITLLNMDESLSAKSYEGKEVHIEIGVMLDKFHKPFEYVSMGYFIVEEPRKDNNLIKLTGYDKMIYFEKPYVSNLTYPTTLLQILQEICTQAGVQLENTSFINSDYLVNEMPNLENVTLRLAVEHISELACSFACINRAGKLEIKTFIDTNVSINADNYYSMKLSEYEHGPIEVISINLENIFALNPTEQLKDNMLNAVKGFTFKPFTTSWQGNPLTAPGDIINVSEKNGVKYKSFIANQKFNFSTGLKCDITTNAKTGIQTEYQSRGPITQTIEKVKKEFASKIEQTESKILLEVEEIGKSVGALQIESDNINAKVEELGVSVGQINVKADEIDLSVKSLDEKVGNVEGQLVIQAGLIEGKVSSTDLNGENLVSLINLTPQTVKIQSKNIDLIGIVTVTDLATEGKTVINGSNITTGNFSADRILGGVLRLLADAQGNTANIYADLAGGYGNLVFSAGGYRFEAGGVVDFSGNQVTGLNVVASFG
jgi:hypothetical protein